MAQLDVDKSIIYYTGNNLDEPLCSIVRDRIQQAGLPIVSVSLRPIDFGTNIVIEGKRSYPTMVKQITVALEHSTSDYVFFCEHDCLYPKEHFDFTPKRDDIFYYNKNVWRWMIGSEFAIRYDRMLPLSCLCVNRKFALEHYQMRMRKIDEWGLDEFRSREPRLARRWGYEPGTKKISRGGLTDDDFETYSSRLPVIDVRHRNTFSRPKISLDEFKHAPTNWEQINIDQILDWDTKEKLNGVEFTDSQP